MADIRIKDLAVTASSSASDDYLAVDGSTNGTRKLSAYSPTFGGNLTVSGGSIVIGSSSSVLYLGTPSSNYLYYDGSSLFVRLGGADRLTIPAASGNLLVGTTTDGGQKLQVNGTAAISSTLTVAGTILSVNTGLFSADATLSSYSTSNGVYLNGHAAGWLRLAGSGGGGAAIQLNGGTGSGATIVFTTNNSTTALTLDGSQNATFAGTIKPQQAATASAPTYVKGAIYFDTTLNKLRVGGATGWETITSV